MGRRLRTAAALTSLALGAAPLPATAQPVYGFDDVPLVGTSCLNATGFSGGGGFAWSGFLAYTNALHDCGPLTGLDAGVVSPANAVIVGALLAGSAERRVSRATPFPFLGAYFTRSSTLWDNPLYVDITGFLRGVPVGTSTMQVVADTPVFHTVAFREVDVVTFQPRLGPGMAAGDIFVMDDFDFTAAPEPSAAALFGLGVAALAAARARRRSAARGDA